MIISVCIATIIGLVGFQENPKSIEEMIQAKVAERVGEFRNNRLKRCNDKVMNRANEIVDSLLVDQARRVTIDTMIKPPKPTKPEKPVLDPINDSLDIEPILPISVDTSNNQ